MYRTYICPKLTNQIAELVFAIVDLLPFLLFRDFCLSKF